MNSFSEVGAYRDGGLSVLWQEGERVFCRAWREESNGDRTALLAVIPASEQPTPNWFDRLAHEYALKDELDSAWAVRPLEIVRDSGRTMLMLEDPGGEPLDRLLGAPMEIGRFLHLAIDIAAALGKLHQRGLVHKDVKPANILVNCAGGGARLTGFGVASRLPREPQAPEAPEFIAGTLAYMAPEQTGRMNRSIDSRSDLYALGVTFYQMLIGSLPFRAADPLEWVHSHIARTPVAPAERSASIPTAISEVVMKLLAKTAEDRYQTAAGLEHDLLRCLLEWERNGRIDRFGLGERDAPGRLMISEKLYGREGETEILLAAFDRVVASGVPELVLVSGYSGIGKSSVVNELHKALVARRGLFASGKFDQRKRDIPYSTLAQASQSLTRSLLTKNDAELALWRDQLREALEPNGRLITDLVPELTLIIGEQPPAPDLDPQQAKGRFQLTFRRFISVFARAGHPLAVFLDDLQWLDAATLDLMEDLLTQVDVRHLMLIGAYRDNEVGANHPLARRLAAIQSCGAKVTEIKLGSLTCEHLGQLIADAIRCEPLRAAPLAQLMHEKTAGNPLFVLQFLHLLADEGLLAFDHAETKWSWDIDRIRDKAYARNVVDLMIAKLARLPLEAQKALQAFACLGNIADFAMLAAACEMSQDGMRKALWAAVRAELIQRLPGAYRFTHDRIQEAAYSFIPEAQRAETHLRIGRLLAASVPLESREDAIFDIVNQLNRGAALIDDRDERELLAELNLIAGRRAKASTAYAAALTYLAAGLAMLSQDAWERRRELRFHLELNRAECEFLTGALVDAEQRLAALSNYADDAVERATVACLRVDLYLTADQPSRAVAIGLDYLRSVGIEWPPHPTDDDIRLEYDLISSQMAGRAIEELIDLPLMRDPQTLATLDVLIRIVPPAVFTNSSLASLVTCRAVNLCLTYGNCDSACYAYSQLATVIGSHFGDYRTAFRFAQLGYDLIEKRGLRRFAGRVCLQYGYLVVWTKPVRTGRDLLRKAFEVSIETGDVTQAVGARTLLNTNFLAAGDPLRDAQSEAEIGLAFARKAGMGHAIDVISAHLGLIKTLRGLTGRFGSLDHEELNEFEIEHRFSHNPDKARAECCYSVRKLQARFFAGDYNAAANAAERAKSLLWTSPGQFEAAEYYFYAALVRTAFWENSPNKEQAKAALAESQTQLHAWAASCPENFDDRAALVDAETARIEGLPLDAERLYDAAIRSARANGFVHNEALANELAARFYEARGFETIARAYLHNARYCYARWGADGKVRQLDERYPHLGEEERTPSPTSTIGAPIEQLDLATVIKVSQAVSGEIVLEKLVDALMRTALEQAGAERGLLILSRGAEPRIEAEATISGDMIVVRLGDQPVTLATLPETILHYVLRTRESVILDDASAQPSFAADPYVHQRHARSILCLPLINQAKLSGVLYLENNLTAHVFTPTRITVLKLLASQAAISLENTRLYGELEQREAKIRRLVDANIIGIFIWDFDGQILEANDAFLSIVGYDREDLGAGRLRWTDLTPPEWLDRYKRGRAPELKISGSLPPFEQEFLQRGGSRVPVMIGLVSSDDSGSQGVAFVVDLTERKRAEAALRASEERWRAMFETAPVGITMRDFEHRRYLTANESFQRIVGYTEDELRHLTALDITHDDDQPATQRRIDSGVIGVLQRKRYRRKDGEVIWVDVTPFVVPSTDSTPTFLGAVIVDISERKRAEEALQQAQADLARLNRVMLLGEMTASIAHEVNQPISAVITNAHAGLRWLNARRPDLNEVRQALSRIVRDGSRAGDVIERIRALVRKVPPHRDRSDINETIHEVIALTQTEVERNGIRLQTRLADDLPLIPADRVQLQQVIMNLIVNAIEAMAGVGDRPRELTIASGEGDTSTVFVKVRDTGPGIDPADLDRLFQSFYTTKPDGIGMGLAISRSIVEAHGGRLSAVPNHPHGAIFQFTVSARADGS